MIMEIGSANIHKLLSGKNTKGYNDLWLEFISNEKPHYNALASPIIQFKLGAIMEPIFYNLFPRDYYMQVKVVNPHQDCLKVTLDYALLSDGKVVDFDELKTVNFSDYLIIEEYRDKPYKKQIEFLKKKYKKNYQQCQAQLYATDLDECNLDFLVIYSDDPEENANRIITEKEYIKFRIKRDRQVINQIRERAKPFQDFKNYHKNG